MGGPGWDRHKGTWGYPWGDTARWGTQDTSGGHWRTRQGGDTHWGGAAGVGHGGQEWDRAWGGGGDSGEEEGDTGGAGSGCCFLEGNSGNRAGAGAIPTRLCRGVGTPHGGTRKGDTAGVARRHPTPVRGLCARGCGAPHVFPAGTFAVSTRACERYTRRVSLGTSVQTGHACPPASVQTPHVHHLPPRKRATGARSASPSNPRVQLPHARCVPPRVQTLPAPPCARVKGGDPPPPGWDTPPPPPKTPNRPPCEAGARVCEGPRGRARGAGGLARLLWGRPHSCAADAMAPAAAGPGARGVLGGGTPRRPGASP